MCPLDRWILTPLLITGLFLSLADDCFAAKRTFPYDAVVNAKKHWYVAGMEPVIIQH